MGLDWMDGLGLSGVEWSGVKCELELSGLELLSGVE